MRTHSVSPPTTVAVVDIYYFRLYSIKMTFLFRGRRNFDNCLHKTITQDTRVRANTDGPVYVTTLSCPNMPINTLSAGDLERARDHERSDSLLRSCAASMCRGCVLVDLSTEEVSQHLEANPLSAEEQQTKLVLDALRNTID